MNSQSAATRTDPLRYPFETHPQPKERMEVAPGVFWLRMPMPGRLDHINVWLLRDEGGWTIVDTGLNRDEIRDCWEALFATSLEGLPVKRVICTHMHTDHAGLAGWLVRRWDVELWMSRATFFIGRDMAAYAQGDMPEEAMRFYKRAGFADEALQQYRDRFGLFGLLMSPLPHGYRRIRNGEYLDIGGREWRAVFGNGHTAEHVCLYCPELKLIIGGDQLLPRITPNVSVNPSEPHANPLKDWLRSCVELRELLPGNLLVLPAHQRLYYGLHERLTALIEHHETSLVKLYELCETPKRAVDVFPALFKNEATGWAYFAATGESIAHLHCGVERRMLTQTIDDKGVAWFKRS